MKRAFGFFASVFAGLSLGSITTAHAQAGDLTSELAMLTPRASAQEPVNIRYTLRNPGETPVRVLKIGTPLEGEFNSKMFRVEANGAEVPYIGRLVKRTPPTESDYLVIEPHAEATATLDLSKGYALSAIGRYNVQLTIRSLDTRPATGDIRSSKPRFVLPASQTPTVSFELTEARSSAVPPTPPALRALTLDEAKQAKKAKAAAYQSCSTTQQSTIDSALAESASMAAGAYLSLAITPVAKRPVAPRYLEWFGAHTTARYDLATTHFNKIQSALANETVTFHCDCDMAGTYAYVYPNDPYHIHLCPVFWTAPLTGTDSQGGTIIHETSHFTVTAGTNDHVYGQTAARNLAATDPTNALDNADNHEYFAENTPALAMGRDSVIGLLLVVVATIVAYICWSRRRVKRGVA